MVNLDETSASVQSHLGIIQGVIQRMATNSTSCKTWCTTIVSAILVAVSDKKNPDLSWVSIFPAILFAILDAYYLALEKGFRNSYKTFVKKLHNGTLSPEDLYSISTEGGKIKTHFEAITSFSIWGFYIPLIILALIVKHLIISNLGSASQCPFYK